MIENLAVIAARDGDRVRLAPFSRTGCARCDAGEGCGGGVFGKLIRRRLKGLQLQDPGLDLRAGDTVVLGLPEAALLRATALAYLTPLIGLFAAAGLAARMSLADPAVAGAGLLGLVAGLLLVPWLRQRGLDTALMPQLLRRASARELAPDPPGNCVNA